MLTTPGPQPLTRTAGLANTRYMRNRRPARERAGLAGWMAVVLLLSAELSARATIANGLIGITAMVALANNLADSAVVASRPCRICST